MQRFSYRYLLAFISFFSFLNWTCTKITTTNLGNDLLPAVDNISTFADTLNIIGTQGILDDSSRIGRFDAHAFGYVSNDPVFGTTQSDLYLELKPNFFPYFFGNTGDTVNPALNARSRFDSAFLCLSVNGFFGDSTKPQKFSAYLLDKNTSNFKDSSYIQKFQPNMPLGQMIGQVSIRPSTLKDTVFLKNGSVTNAVTFQIRIPLSPAFLSAITANLDTTTAGSPNNIFRSDSLFKALYKGFAVICDPASSGNGLFYTNLTDAKTHLAIHYLKINNNKLDTGYSTFPFSNGSSASVSVAAHAINLVRNRSMAEIATPEPDALYLQTSPGTFALLNIPALSSLNNRIIHRAEITIEQIPSSNPVAVALDNILLPPSYLYLDLKDTGTVNTYGYKPIYKDLNPNSFYNPDNNVSFLPPNGVNGIDFGYFGGYLRKKTDQLGNTVHYYTFNISRYVQDIVTRGNYNFPLRIYAPYNLNYYGFPFPFRNSLANGRIKVGNGNNANYKMRLRIVYSKI